MCVCVCALKPVHMYLYERNLYSERCLLYETYFIMTFQKRAYETQYDTSEFVLVDRLMEVRFAVDKYLHTPHVPWKDCVHLHNLTS